jgi:hypothetical protein
VREYHSSGAATIVYSVDVRRDPLRAGGLVLVSCVVLAACASAALAQREGASFVPTVRCDEIVRYSPNASTADGNRLVLDGVLAPAFYLGGGVRTSGRFPYWWKAPVMIHASSGVLTVRVAKPWRDRVRVVWGVPGTPAPVVRFAACPSSVDTWNGYSGGFLLRTKAACVPLIFTLGGRQATLRFGLGRHC